MFASDGKGALDSLWKRYPLFVGKQYHLAGVFLQRVEGVVVHGRTTLVDAHEG